MTKVQGIIPIPTFLYSDEELVALHERLRDLTLEVDRSSNRVTRAMLAIQFELSRRTSTYEMSEDGRIVRRLSKGN